MEISLDNPGFQVDITDAEVHYSDPPKSSGSSSSSGDSARQSCNKCHGRMSSFSLDKHPFCIKCHGAECSLTCRCDECLQWTKEEMESYVKLRKSLSSKGRRSKSSSSSSSPPPSTPHDSDFDHKMAAQFDSVHKSVDQKLEAMSSSLISKFSSMLAQFQLGLNPTSFSDDSAVPGYSACPLEPPSLLPSVSTKSHTGLRFREGGEDPVPHESGLVQGFASARSSMDETPGTSQHPPSEDTVKPQGHSSQQAPGFSGDSQSGTGFSFHLEEEDDDDRESVVELPSPDKTYARLISYIHDRFPHSHPASAPRLPSSCEFEEFFAISESAPVARQILLIYPRVSELVDSSADRASRLARESRPLHRVVPLKRKMFHIGDPPDYCAARFLNPDFCRISKNKTILKTRASSVSLADLEKLDRGSRTILAGDS